MLLHHTLGLLDDIWQTPSSAVSKDLRGIRSKLALEPFKFPLSHILSVSFSMAFLFQNWARDDPTCLLLLLLSLSAFHVYLYCTDGILKQDWSGKEGKRDLGKRHLDFKWPLYAVEYWSRLWITFWHLCQLLGIHNADQLLCKIENVKKIKLSVPCIVMYPSAQFRSRSASAPFSVRIAILFQCNLRRQRMGLPLW